jgi:hypothetical protein
LAGKKVSAAPNDDLFMFLDKEHKEEDKHGWITKGLPIATAIFSYPLSLSARRN